MKKRTYLIVQHSCDILGTSWKAHRRGLFRMIGLYVDGTLSGRNADACEANLRRVVASRGIKPIIIRAVCV